MAVNPKLLQTLITIMQEDHPPGFFLNKQFDIYKFAQKLLQELENRRSAATAITREQAASIGNDNLQFSAIKHESRINTLYRLIGLPTEIDLENNLSLLDANGKEIKTKSDLAKTLLQREYAQLEITFHQFLTTNTTKQLDTQINSTQAQGQQLVAQLFDPNYLQKNTTRLFPIVQYSQIEEVVELRNRIAPSFATTEERYVNSTLIDPPFLESVITIRLLQQSGGAQINEQGAVEDAILQSLGYALGELAKQYNRNQSEAEKQLLDGIARIREKVNAVNSAAVKKADLEANTRENDNITTELDIRSNYSQAQLKVYDAVISLLPTENDIIPIGINIEDTPFQSRNIKNNALTTSFLEIVNANADAIKRSIVDTEKVMQKRQLTQDKLTAELGSVIAAIGGISLAEIIIVLSALFVLDEEDLVGLIPKSRFDQLIGATNNNTSASSSNISDSGQANTAQKQINIYDILKQFENNTNKAETGKRTPTTQAIKIFQDTVKSIYDAFVIKLGKSHILLDS